LDIIGFVWGVGSEIVKQGTHEAQYSFAKFSDFGQLWREEISKRSLRFIGLYISHWDFAILRECTALFEIFDYN
jgi:hypothetical protein